MSLKRKNAAATGFEPAEEDIQQAAYYLWLESGCLPGRDEENWFAARELLRHRHRAARPRRRQAAAPAPTPLIAPAVTEPKNN
jgi:hypothetical protein